jgi:hypothetical protein
MIPTAPRTLLTADSRVKDDGTAACTAQARPSPTSETRRSLVSLPPRYGDI